MVALRLAVAVVYGAAINSYTSPCSIPMWRAGSLLETPIIIEVRTVRPNVLNHSLLMKFSHHRVELVSAYAINGQAVRTVYPDRHHYICCRKEILLPKWYDCRLSAKMGYRIG